MGLSLSLGLSQSAYAQRKTDVITLHNGDRITGEIKSLESGRLSLGTDAMGTLAIEWKEIASVSSNYNYEVRLVGGERFFGSVRPGAAPGAISIEDVFGQHSVGWQEVVELRPIEKDFADRVDLYISANYAFTKASGVRQTEVRANLAYEDERSLNSLTSRSTVSDTREEKTTSARVSLARKVWTDRRALYRLGFGGFERNDELGLDSRLTLGGGLGRYFVESNNSHLLGSFSVQALSEENTQGDTQESLEAVLTVEYARWRFDSPEVNLLFDSSLYPSLTESGRVRADSNMTLRWELIGDLFWDLSAWGTYDNSAVDGDAGEFDWGITTGIGWEY